MTSLLSKIVKKLFGLLACIIGASIVLWCLYNVLFVSLPEYSGPSDVIGLLVAGFGIGPTMFSYGLKWMRPQPKNTE